jgi:hypothetical protein
MLGNLKNYALIGLGFIAMLFFGLFNWEKAKRQKEKIKGIQRARKIERKASNAMVEGLQNEQDVLKDTDTSKRDFFK